MSIMLSVKSMLCLTVLVGMCLAGAVSHADEIRLIIRGDDLGMTQGSLAAFEEAMNNGVLNCCSLQAAAPWFAGAAELCNRNPGWCVGMHLTLVGEWQGYRWRPVLPWSEVPSIVDEHGFLYTSPKEMNAHNPDPADIEKELRAQIKLALDYGVNVQYLDNHYFGVPKNIVDKLGKEFNLPVSQRFGEITFEGIYDTPPEQKTEEAVRQIEALTPGLYLWYCHPGIDSPEQNALFHTSVEDIFARGGVGPHRTAVTKTLTSIDLKAAIMRKGIVLTTYRDIWEEQNK